MPFDRARNPEENKIVLTFFRIKTSQLYSLQPRSAGARAAPKRVRKMKKFDKKFDEKREKSKNIAKNGEKRRKK